MKSISEKQKVAPVPRRRTPTVTKPRKITPLKKVEDMPQTSAPSAKIIPFPTNLKEFHKNNPLPKTPPRELEKREVIVPEKQSEKGLVSVSVTGDSLRDTGINDGDTLVCQKIFEKADLTNGKLVIAELPCLGLVVKFYFKFENKIIFRSANPRYEDLVYTSDLVSIKAIVIQSIRYWN